MVIGLGRVDHPKIIGADIQPEAEIGKGFGVYRTRNNSLVAYRINQCEIVKTDSVIIKGDAFFPEFDEKSFREISREDFTATKNTACSPPYTFFIFERLAA